MNSNVTIRFGREICGNLEEAESREWLVTNGIGGYASGTIAGGMSRRYHGLLMATLHPPVGRTQLVAWVDEIVRHGGAELALATHRWASGAVEPKGFQHIEEFRLEGRTPFWTYALGGARLEKRVFMQQRANTTYVQYTMVEGSGSLEMELKALVNYRDFHGATHAGEWQMRVEPVERGIRVIAFDGATPFFLMSGGAVCEVRNEWYRDYFFAAEKERGLADREDHLFAALFHAQLQVGESFSVVLTTDESSGLDAGAILVQRAADESTLLNASTAAKKDTSAIEPDWLSQLVLAADQFIVKRASPGEPEGPSVIAGYHWFGDWGRDTMIALPGLTLATGRPEIAARILRTFARFVDRGMLPNVFPDAGQAPEYNTVGAALWYFEAVRQCVAATNDLGLLHELFPVLGEIIDWHVRGTRYKIHVDPEDGLLFAGEPGVQLTWMDAKVGDWVVTPRIGKPIEINALWLNALVTMTQFAQMLKKPTAGYASLAKRVRAGFARFWNESTQCCFDVLDGPEGNDSSIRPNQIFAVSLPECALTSAQQRAVVETCGRQLLTSHGLRSLTPDDSSYRGRYEGSSLERDGAYHQGTVWAWLLGPFALAHLRVYNDAKQAARFLEPLAAHLNVHGLGSISEIFDGDAPFAPRGCISQAWSVAEVLRAWIATAEARRTIKPERAKGISA